MLHSSPSPGSDSRISYPNKLRFAIDQSSQIKLQSEHGLYVYSIRNGFRGNQINIYLFYSMDLTDKLNQNISHVHDGRKLNIILLSNNGASKADYRSSAFKQTEVDPLEYRNAESQAVFGRCLSELEIRVERLRERIKQLQNLNTDGNTEACLKGRKRRRRFQQMERTFECQQCERKYGSETTLKLHIKIKHTSKQT